MSLPRVAALKIESDSASRGDSTGAMGAPVRAVDGAAGAVGGVEKAPAAHVQEGSTAGAFGASVVAVDGAAGAVGGIDVRTHSASR